MTTLYDVLEVSRDATQEDVQVAYREKVKQYHPDVSDHPDAEDRFRVVKRAEEVLGDPDERARYDRLGHESYRRVAGTPDLGDWPTPQDRDSPDPEGRDSPDPEGSDGPDPKGRRTADSDDGGESDHSRGISVGGGESGSSNGSQETGPSSGSRESGSSSASRESGSGRSAEARSDETDWWDDVWESDPGRREAGGPRRGSAVGGGEPATTSRTAERKRVQASARRKDDGLWSAEVEEPIEPTRRRRGIAERLHSGEALVLSMVLLVIYPVFVYFSLDATLSPAVNVLVGVTTIGVAVVALTRPAVSLIVFGVWTLLSPLLLTFLGQPVTSFRGLIVVAAFLLPLALTGLVILAAPR